MATSPLVLSTEVMERMLSAALACGGEFAEVYGEARANRAVSAEDGRLERVNLGREGGAGVRVIRGDRTAYAYTEDLQPEALMDCATMVARMAAGGQQADQGAPTAPRRPSTQALWPEEDPLGGAFPEVAHMADCVRRADERARQEDARVRQATPLCVDTDQSLVVANSEGALARDRRRRVRLRVRVLLRTADGRSATGIDTKGGTTDYSLLDGDVPEELAMEAVRQAATMLEAGPAPAGELPVVLAAGSGGVVIHEACGHGLEGDIATGLDSAYHNRLGEQVADECVTLIDDPTLPGAWGSYEVDDEGTPASRTTLIEQGTLVSFLTDRRHADKGLTTGNARRASFRHLPSPRMSNTFVAPGTMAPGDVVGATSYGLLAQRISGGSVEPTTGNFTFNVREAYLVRDGRVAEPVYGATLVGNSLEAMRRIDLVADDLAHVPAACGKDGQRAWVTVGQPTLRVSSLGVSGTRRR